MSGFEVIHHCHHGGSLLGFIFKKFRGRKLIIFILLFVISCSLVISHYSFHLYYYYNPPIVYFSNNYFMSAEETQRLGYTVNTPYCSIVNISAWDEAILPILAEEEIIRETCDKGQWRHWTYTQSWNLVMNETSIRESGYSMDVISCCYFTISRINQSLSNYDEYADLRVKFSSCEPLTKVQTPMSQPYIRVQCSGKYWPLTSEVLYRRFHAIPVPPPSALRKHKFWRKQKRKGPNVIIIGIDSMSRLSFMRTMPKTRRALQQFGAVEMLGYTKVGENTLPNIMAGFGGYSEAQMKELCFFNASIAQDGCPYMWDRFAEANYLTAFIEDAPRLAIFNYLKTGYVHSPTDIFLRPFMLGIQTRLGIPYLQFPCIDDKVVHRVALRYISDIVGMAERVKVPVFLFSWITSLAHDSLIGGKFGDDAFEALLKSLDLNNTVLVFMSDHGYRFGSIRQTFPGWYEDKLPNFWMYLPHSMTRDNSNLTETLKTNAIRLTSPFDLFWTLSQIVDEFTMAKPLTEGISPKTQRPLSRAYGQSLLKEIPISRHCKEAGISENYCACLVPNRLPRNDSRLEGAAKGAVDAVNERLPSVCSPLDIKTIEGGAILHFSQGQSPNEPSNGTFVVDFYTKPGGFLFEATVNFYAANKSDPGIYVMNSDVLRMNRISGDVSCVKESFLERICYCRTNNLSRNIPAEVKL